MKLKDEINKINKQTIYIRDKKEDISDIMSKFGKEVDDFLKD